jgi:hypothetical protein
MREVSPCTSTSAAGESLARSSRAARSRTESRPPRSRLPKMTRRAPVRRPRAREDTGSARPLQCLMKVAGETVLSAPAPSRLRERRSIRPSRQSRSDGSTTSNGATATRFASSGGSGEPRERQRLAPSAASPVTTPRLMYLNRRRAPLPGPVWTSCSPTGASSARANSAALVNRSAGERANARVIACSIPSETSRIVRRCGTGSLKRFAMMACAVGPVKGGSPASISYATQPRE